MTQNVSPSEKCDTRDFPIGCSRTPDMISWASGKPALPEKIPTLFKHGAPPAHLSGSAALSVGHGHGQADFCTAIAWHVPCAYRDGRRYPPASTRIPFRRCFGPGSGRSSPPPPLPGQGGASAAAGPRGSLVIIGNFGRASLSGAPGATRRRGAGRGARGARAGGAHVRPHPASVLGRTPPATPTALPRKIEPHPARAAGRSGSTR